MIGTIKRLMEKGFGFIESPDLVKEKIQGDIFFHFSALEGGIDTFDTLREGQRVSFETVAKKDGKKQAANVQVLGEGDE
ncbi:MAG: cold shock domain-containing protein [Candidatus Gracilibacteria bacterium]|nr:cold shock domain-containing protein [Candidatus Gracilibacteria bacterium]